MRWTRTVLSALAVGAFIGGYIGVVSAPAWAQGLTVAGAAPSSLPPGAMYQDVNVFGAGFADGDTVSLGAGVTVHSVTVESGGSSLIASVSVAGSAALSSRNVTVANGASHGSCTGCFAVSNIPQVSAIVPVFGLDASLPQGASEQELDVSGANFMPKATISFGAGSGITVDSVAYQNPEALALTVSVSSSAPVQADNVTVTNPVTGSPSGTCTGCLAVSDTPLVSSTSNGSAASGTLPPGASQQTVDLQGANFMPKAKVSFGAGSGVTADSVTYQSPSSLTVAVTVSTHAPLQADTVTVTNPATGSPSGSCASCFTVSDTPAVSSVSNQFGFGSSLPQGASQQVLYLQGANFMPKAKVSFGTGSGVTADSVSYQSPSSLTVTVTVSVHALLQADTVTVTNPATGSPSGSCASCFTVSDTPAVTGLFSQFGLGFGVSLPQGASEQALDLEGTNFMPKAKVSFGTGSGVTADSVAYQSPSSLIVTVTVSAHALLQADTVTVTNPAAGSPSGPCPGCFTVSDIPQVLTAGGATLSPGTTDFDLFLSGANFQPDATVSLSPGTGITINAVRYENPFEVVANITVSSTAPVQSDTVTVTNPSAPGSPSGSCFDCLSVT